MPVDARRVQQAHDGRRPLTRAQAAGEQPVRAANGDGPDLVLHPSGYYAWKANPVSARELDNQRLLPKLKQAWLESGGIYGYRKITLDMRDLGEGCGKHRVYGLLKREGLRSQTGYKRRPGHKSGPPAVVAPNHLQQVFTASQPNQAWVTDVTYIRTHEGWLYLAVGLTQKEMAKLLGVSVVSIYKWETGDVTPRAAQLDRVREVLKMGVRAARRQIAE